MFNEVNKRLDVLKKNKQGEITAEISKFKFKLRSRRLLIKNPILNKIFYSMARSDLKKNIDKINEKYSEEYKSLNHYKYKYQWKEWFKNNRKELAKTSDHHEKELKQEKKKEMVRTKFTNFLGR